MKNIGIITLLFILAMTTQSLAQNVSINNSGAAPDASAMLNVQSTTKGMLVPRMSTSQRENIPNLTNGLLVFDTSSNGFWFFDGEWQELAEAGDLGGIQMTIADEDNDTKIQVEESTDEDIIRFDVAGVESMVLDNNGNVGIGLGNDAPDARLHIKGAENDGTTATLKITSGNENMLFDGNEIDTDNSNDLILNGNVSADVILANGGGNVGIRTSNPDRPLSIKGAGTFNEWISFKNTNGITTWHINSLLGGLNFAETGVSTSSLIFEPGGNMGINHPNPSALLHVRGNSSSPNIFSLQGTGAINRFLVQNDGNAAFNSAVSNSVALNVRNPSASNATVLYVGSWEGTRRFEVRENGDVLAPFLPFGDHENKQYRESDGMLFYDNSSRRYKENISPLEDDFALVLKAQPKTYTRPAGSCRWELGYIAEEMDSLGLDKLVSYDSKGIPDGFNYEKMIVYVTEVMKVQAGKTSRLGSQRQVNLQKANKQKVQIAFLWGALVGLMLLLIAIPFLNFEKIFKRPFQVLPGLFLLCLLSTNHHLQAQNVSINDDGTQADASAMLDVQSTTKGMLIPRMTGMERTNISNPAKSLLVFDTDTQSFWFFNDYWRELATMEDVSGIPSVIRDADGDTKVQVEESDDEDRIRFDVAGTESMLMDNNGNVGIGVSAPDTKLHISGPDNTGAVAPLIIRTFNNIGDRRMLLDGNEIDVLGMSDRLFLNRNSGGDVILANGGGFAGFGTGNPDRPLSLGYTGGEWIRFRDIASESKWRVSSFNGGINFDRFLGGTLLPELYLNPGGNVGIHTNSPNAGLTILARRVSEFFILRALTTGPQPNGSIGNGFEMRADGNAGFNRSVGFIGLNVVSPLTSFNDNFTSILNLENRSGTDRFTVSETGMVYARYLPFGDHHNMQFESDDGRFFYDDSSRRNKRNIKVLKDDYRLILQAKPKTYTRPADSSRWEVGYIAEEMDNLGLGKLVSYNTAGIPDGFNYEKMILYVIEILKEEVTKTENLQSREGIIGTQISLQEEQISLLWYLAAALTALIVLVFYLKIKRFLYPPISIFPKKEMNRHIPVLPSLLLGLFLIGGSYLHAQNVGIGPEGTQPHPSAMLDVQSNESGLLIPRMGSTQRANISGPAIGLLVYDTDTDSFWFFNGSWSELVEADDNIGIPAVVEDADNDTKIQVEANPDEDRIRFDVLGTERMILDNNGHVGIGLADPETNLDIYGNEPNGTLKIGSGSQNMLLDGTSINTGSDGDLFLNNNSGGDVIIAQNYRRVFIRTDISNFQQYSLGLRGSGTIGNEKWISFKNTNGLTKWYVDSFNEGLTFGGDNDFKFRIGVNGEASLNNFDSNAALNAYTNDNGEDLIKLQSIDGFIRFEVNANGSSGFNQSYDDIALNVQSPSFSSGLTILNVESSDGSDLFRVMDNGHVLAPEIPFGDHENMQYRASDGRYYYDNSSRRYKRNIQPLEDDFHLILKAQPKTYTRPGDSCRWEIGYIAEEMDSLGLGKLVSYNAEGLPNGFNYEKMILYVNEVLKGQVFDNEDLAGLQDNLERQVHQQATQVSSIWWTVIGFLIIWIGLLWVKFKFSSRLSKPLVFEIPHQ